jgi:MFS transporter, UMF1 family
MVPRQINHLEPPPSSWRPRSAGRDGSPAKSFTQQSTQSNEADDERSSFSSFDNHAMGPSRRASFSGEDTRLVSRKEISGFYMYGWAAEVSMRLRAVCKSPLTVSDRSL